MAEIKITNRNCYLDVEVENDKVAIYSDSDSHGVSVLTEEGEMQLLKLLLQRTKNSDKIKANMKLWVEANLLDGDKVEEGSATKLNFSATDLMDTVIEMFDDVLEH